MQEKKPISHFVAGLIIAGILIVISLITTVISSEGSQKSGWINYLIIIGGLIFFINQFGKARNNQATFGELFSYGFKTTALLTLIFVVFLIILSFVYPELKEKAIEASRAEMEKQKDASDADIERGMAIVSKYFWALAIGGTVLGFAVIGAIGSLIGAAITKKEKPNPLRSIDHLDQPNS